MYSDFLLGDATVTAATAKVRSFMELNKNGTTQTSRPLIGDVSHGWWWGSKSGKPEKNSFALCNFPRTKAGGSECSTKGALFMKYATF